MMPRVVHRWFVRCLSGVIALVITGCTSPGQKRMSSSGEAKLENTSKAIKNEPKVTVRTIQKWNPIWWFGNVDDPEPPEWYKPDDPSRRRKWLMRNPLHNFTFYVIGVADKPFERVGRHPKDVFNQEGGWNLATSRHRCWRLPFISYTRGRFATYWGWRERGNFGVKLTFRSENKPATVSMPSSPAE